jgi:DNA-binding Lrp family transcriptional regulator
MEIIDQIREIILEDSRISPKSMAQQLGISHEWVGSIIHEDLVSSIHSITPHPNS